MRVSTQSTPSRPNASGPQSEANALDFTLSVTWFVFSSLSQDKWEKTC